jgi:thiol-disulfide isomerase/thioredoxin
MTTRLKTFALSAAFAACALIATSTAAIAAQPENGPPAPELTGITQWLNSEPLKLQQLRGKVVLVDFWTYSCINCANTLPYVKSWNQKYKDQGLTVIGVHTPEYPFERDTGNVKTALKRLGIIYPVAQDNQYATWNAYNNQYWPAFYLIDKQGQIVYTHFGEGDYAQTEARIQALLAQKN